jgi:predicted TIM-barrel fold metal-dependent hydrolase
VTRILSADSHMLVLDEHVLAHLASRHHEAYLAGRGAHRRPGVSIAKPGPGPAGEWDPKARLADMDLDGVDGEVLYTDPTGGAGFYALEATVGLAAMRAFNSAALDFASVAPDRLVVVHLLPLHDIDMAIAELHRIVEDGARAVQLPLYPGDAGLSPYYDERYAALWSALEEVGTPISLHVCPPAGRGLGKDPTPARGIFQVMPPILMSQPMVELILTGTFTRHPRLRVVLVEAGLGWVPYMLDRLDRVHHKSRWAELGMPLDDLPSSYWYRNMAATFEEDELGLSMRERIGVDNLLWATDYPHPDTTFPRSRQVVAEEFAACRGDEMVAMTSGNTARLYKFDTVPGH